MTITIDQMNKQAEKIAELRNKESEISMEKKRISDELALAEGQMLEMLEESNLTTYQSPVGKLTVSYRNSVKTPKSDEDRKAFFEYLKSQGVYDTMVTVNSATLNAFYKTELERAKEDGVDDFSIPGLNEVTVSKILSFRR